MERVGGAVGNREDLERIARPEGARPKCSSGECFQQMRFARMSATKKYQSASSLHKLSELTKHA